MACRQNASTLSTERSSSPSSPASSAWWGFTTAADRQRLEAVIRRGVRSGLCDLNQLALNEVISDTDDKLFFQAMYNNSRVLNSLLPNETHRTYNLRQRRHNRTLLTKQYTVCIWESIYVLVQHSDNEVRLSYGELFSKECPVMSVGVGRTFGALFVFVCLFVCSISQKQMNLKCSNLV